MVMRTFLLLLLGAITASAIPSQRDTLAAAKRDAQGVYTAAQRTPDRAKFAEAISRLKAVGDLVVSSANQAPISASSPNSYTYPGDVKTSSGRKSYDQKMA
jgi:hypothetical protein